MNHITIAFYGNFKPLHIEGEAIADCVKSALGKCQDESIRETIRDISRDWNRQRKAGINIVSASFERHSHSVSIREGNRDTWLDSMTSEFPGNPLIQY